MASRSWLRDTPNSSRLRKSCTSNSKRVCVLATFAACSLTYGSLAARFTRMGGSRTSPISRSRRTGLATGGGEASGREGADVEIADWR